MPQALKSNLSNGDDHSEAPADAGEVTNKVVVVRAQPSAGASGPQAAPRPGDWLTGDDRGNDIEGGTGDNLIRGLGGNDVIIARAGHDLVYGDDGDDYIEGNLGFDTLRGGRGDDRIFGQKDDDVLHGGAGEDTLNGGPGRDQLFGGKQADILIGGYGGDELNGAQGNDRLAGGGAADTLKGGAGVDILIGGRGRDVFVFTDNFGKDLIADYKDGEDRMDFSGHSGVSSFADLTITQIGDNVLISDGAGGEVRMRDVALDEIDESDFIFGA